MANNTEKCPVFSSSLAKYEVPALEELPLCKRAIIAGLSIDDEVDNEIDENEEGY